MMSINQEYFHVQQENIMNLKNNISAIILTGSPVMLLSPPQWTLDNGNGVYQLGERPSDLILMSP